MDTEDLRTLSRVGRAFWADPRRAEPATVESVTAVSLLGADSSEEAYSERAMRALLERAMREGMATNTRHNLKVIRPEEQLFYRLLPQERMLLVTLHLGRWGYERLARVLKETPERVEEMAWQLRLSLAPGKYPAGPERRGPHCPEYDARRPWTQRFLDEEIDSGQQRHYLQNHLMACDSCRNLLGRCRDVYYLVDRVVPRSAEDGFVDGLQSIFRKARILRSPVDATFFEGLGIFLGRRDVRISLAVLAALVLLTLWK